MINIVKDINEILSSFIRGQLVVAGLVGILTTLSLLILKVDFAVIVGMIAGLADVVPYFWSSSRNISCINFCIFRRNKKSYMGGIYIYNYTADREQCYFTKNWAKYRCSSCSYNFSLFIAGKFLGIFGFLVAVPVVGVIKVIGKHLIAWRQA